MIKKVFLGFFRNLWRTADFTRRFILNALVVGLLLAFIIGAWQGFQPQLKDNTVLRLAPYGQLVEQWQGDPVDVALSQAFGESSPQTRLFDLVRAIEAAATDDKITGLVIETDGLFAAAPAQLNDLATAIAQFRDANKPVWAYGSRFSKGQYYLAAQSDQVFMDPYGDVLLDGFSVYQNYFADGVDKLKATVNVFRVGEYKSAVEPWLRNDMSAAAKEANQAWLDGLWKDWREAVALRRDVKPARIESYSQDLAQLLRVSQGDAALTAQAAGLVDQLATPQQFTQHLVDQVGQLEGVDRPEYRQIGLYDYLAELDMQAFQQQAVEPLPTVAVVVIEGALMEGAYGDGYANLAAIEEQLLQACYDENVAAVVVRVASPGGTITAAESLRRAVAQISDQGKPVLVSMGAVAASGGYWLATAADQIWAQPNTLTGSIGIFGILPTFENSLAELGIHTDGVATSAYAGGLRVDRPLAPAMRDSIQLYIAQGYQRFLDTVAAGRQLTAEDVEAAAKGRVWTGRAAQTLGLVDQLGGLSATIAAAATAADVEEYAVDFYAPSLTFFDELLLAVSAGVSLPKSWQQDWQTLSQGLNPWRQQATLNFTQQVVQRAHQQPSLSLPQTAFVWWPGQLQ